MLCRNTATQGTEDAAIEHAAARAQPLAASQREQRGSGIEGYSSAAASGGYSSAAATAATAASGIGWIGGGAGAAQAQSRCYAAVQGATVYLC